MKDNRPAFGNMSTDRNSDFSLSSSNSSSGMDWSTIFVGASVIVIVSSVTFVSTIMISSKGEAKKSDYFAGEITPVAREYKKKAYKSAAVFGSFSNIHAKLKVNKTNVGLDAIDSELHEKCLKPSYPNTANDVARLGHISLKPRQAAKYINCTMGIQKSRLCDSYYRKRLAKRLSGVITKEAANRAYVKRVLGSKSLNGVAMRRMVDFNKKIKNSAKNGISGGTRRGPVITSSMGSRISELSKHGLLNKSDFGLSYFAKVPPEVERYMVEQTVEVCPSWF